MKSKKELIGLILTIDEQLRENRKVLEPYVGKEVQNDSSIWQLVESTKKLIMVQIILRNELENSYGL